MGDVNTNAIDFADLEQRIMVHFGVMTMAEAEAAIKAINKTIEEGILNNQKALIELDSLPTPGVYRTEWGNPYTAVARAGRNNGQFANKVAKNRARNKAARKARRK